MNDQAVTISKSRRVRRPVLTDKQVMELRPKPRRYFHPDPELPKHGVRIHPDGRKSYYIIARDPWNKQRWVRVGAAAELKIAEAREIARAVIKRIEAGEPAFPPVPVKPDSVEEVAQSWLKRHVEKEGLRSQAEIRRCLAKYVFPVWKDRPLAELRRGDVTKLLDAIEEAHGARQADYVFSIVGSIMRWHAARVDDYVPPVVAKMRRYKPAERKRERILDDDEIRALWVTAAELGTYGALVKLALLTGQRRAKLAGLRWSDIEDGTWHVRSEQREKGTAPTLRLPRLALDVMEAQPRHASNSHVFAAAAGGGPFNSWSQHAGELAAKMRKRLPALEPFVFHDLRRTARSLLSRAGVSSDHAERVLGHAIPGVAGIYDRHKYENEIGAALGKLAALVELIVNPADDEKVVPIGAAVRP